MSQVLMNIAHTVLSRSKLLTEVLQVVGKGLSALTEAQLGMALDKTLQCSSWGSRPLTQAQVVTPHTNHHDACALQL